MDVASPDPLSGGGRRRRKEKRRMLIVLVNGRREAFQPKAFLAFFPNMRFRFSDLNKIEVHKCRQSFFIVEWLAE